MHAAVVARLRRTPRRTLSPAARFGPDALSRRGFLRFGAGALVGGAVVRRGLSRPLAAAAPADPVPIPIGSFGFHVNAPAAGDPDDADPVTITDFNGFSGLAYISGLVTRTNNVTKQEDVLPFLFADMRFMSGEYRGADGQIHQGTFGFI
ncbi:MAG TPA: hypothetical protein VL309_07130 [Vicinamibacterales bacterium]|jgi:hypothetical protein|nr:hypothetical protein [Vicinamibacterales bacterium]